MLTTDKLVTLLHDFDILGTIVAVLKKHVVSPGEWVCKVWHLA